MAEKLSDEIVRLETPDSSPRPVPTEITRRVGQEILSGALEPGIWAEALAQSEGHSDDAQAIYSRMRIAQLMEQRKRTIQRAESMEFRRVNTCLGVKSVRELLDGVSRKGMVNFPRQKLPFIWAALLAIGLAGCITAAPYYFRMALPTSIQLWLPVISLLTGTAVVASVLAATRGLPQQRLRLVWGDAMVAACLLVCLASFMLGIKIVMRQAKSPVYTTQSAPVTSDGPRVASGLMDPELDARKAIAARTTKR